MKKSKAKPVEFEAKLESIEDASEAEFRQQEVKFTFKIAESGPVMIRHLSDGSTTEQRITHPLEIVDVMRKSVMDIIKLKRGDDIPDGLLERVGVQCDDDFATIVLHTVMDALNQSMEAVSMEVTNPGAKH